MNIDFTTMMPAHKLVELNKYVTGLEHLTRSCSENSDEVNTTSKESIDKHSDDVNTNESNIIQNYDERAFLLSPGYKPLSKPKEASEYEQ